MIPLRIAAGILLLLAPGIASAEVDCEQLDDLKAISQHYVQPALDRADAGIAYAAEATTNVDFFSFYLPGWARNISGTFARVIDSRQRLTGRASDLANTTPCLRYDQILLECKMDDVRKALDSELERGSFVAILRLQSVLLFLQERLYHLERGSADGTYADQRWDQQRAFDKDPVPPPSGPLCPFHSDYTPPRMTGYGCDATALAAVDAYGLGFVSAELEGLRAIESEIDRFREIMPLLQSLSSPGSSTTPSPVGEREHKTLVGCQEEAGTCSDDPSLACGSDEFCASKGKGACLRDTTSPTIPKRATRGPFSYPRDHLQLLSDFVDKRIVDGLSRTFPEGWAKTQDLPLNSTARNDRARDNAWLGTSRTSLRVFFRSVSGVQGREEGSIFPEAQDSQLEIAESLSDMRASIGELSRLASRPQGVRGFVLDMAYFLRRTCVYRPCLKRLEQIMRITMADACFPYTNGEFLSDSENNPRWKKCALAACIQIDDEEGNPIQLPSNCQEILP